MFLNIIFFLHRSCEIMPPKKICEIFYLHCLETFLNVMQINKKLSYSYVLLTI